MAIAQWVEIAISNSFRASNITIKNAQTYWGKFYKNGNKNDEISAGAVNGTTIPAGSTENIYSCGRSDAASGTEGVIDLYEGDTKICTIYWSCPWGSKSNDFQVQNRNSKAGYMVSIGDWNRDSGALGKVEVEVAKKG